MYLCMYVLVYDIQIEKVPTSKGNEALQTARAQEKTDKMAAYSPEVCLFVYLFVCLSVHYYLYFVKEIEFIHVS
jgi:hypothetical protein